MFRPCLYVTVEMLDWTLEDVFDHYQKETYSSYEHKQIGGEKSNYIGQRMHTMVIQRSV